MLDAIKTKTKPDHGPSSSSSGRVTEGSADEACLTGWEPQNSALWYNQPIRVGHRLHHSSLFSTDHLAKLIESYPREHYNIIHMGQQGTERRYWREGDTVGLSGHDVLEAISKGRFWLNLRRTNLIDKRYNAVLDNLFGELEHNVPGLKTYNHECGILISSPRAQVYYHADLPGQLLIQIAGHKRIYFYPPARPFLKPEHLEHIAIYGIEVDIPYENWYDQYAHVYDFKPGEMVHWPHNAPHRIENEDSLNISMTVEYWTEAIRRSNMVIRANGISRYRFGWAPRSTSISGISFWSKAVLQKALGKSSWMKKQKAERRPIEFKLDRANLGSIVETAKR
jgi:hypothetical protein